MLALGVPAVAFGQRTDVDPSTSPVALSPADSSNVTTDIALGAVPNGEASPASTVGAPTPNANSAIEQPRAKPAVPLVGGAATSHHPDYAPATPTYLDRAPVVDEKLAPTQPTALKETPASTATATPSNWHFGGYSELLLTTSFYHPDLKTNDSTYRNTQLDLARFSLFVGTDITKRISFSSEIEFEHGGTGVAREIEGDEFGEYETEVEKGGEIVLEQAYLEGRPTDWLTLRAGHLLVPVGMTTQYHTPILFSSTRRPESESQILPSIWHENGVEAGIRASDFTLRAQLVTGLDSTGFSSNHWIAGGMQRSFERPQFNDMATVIAVDYLGVPSAVFGASFYSSGSNRNRPKRDLYDVSGRVTLGDLHARFQHGPLKLRGLVLLGHLQNAATITRANASLSSNLGVSRTAVGSAAYAAWVEVAYDVLSLFLDKASHRLDLFARFDAYDSMWRAGADFDNPLLQRRTITTGLNYFPHPRVVTKVEFVSRWLNENNNWDRRQHELNAALGFAL